MRYSWVTRDLQSEERLLEQADDLHAEIRDPRSEIRDPRSRASRFRVFVERRIHGMQIEPVHLFGHPALNTLEPLRHSGAARFGAKPIINSMLSCTSALDSNEPGE